MGPRPRSHGAMAQGLNGPMGPSGLSNWMDADRLFGQALGYLGRMGGSDGRVGQAGRTGGSHGRIARVGSKEQADQRVRRVAI